MQDGQGRNDQAGAAKVSRTRRWAGALALAAVLAVLGAALTGLSIIAGSRTPATIARDPIELHPEGDFTHPAGFLMPEKAGPFEREKVIQYDQLGRDVSAGYNALVGKGTPLPVVVTLYVYPARPGEDLDAQFDKVIREIGGSHGGARPEFRNDILLGPRQFVGRYAVFGYAEPWGGLTQDVPLRSYLVLYGWNGWWVKWRATTPAPVDPERMRAIVDLTESLLPPEVEPQNPREPAESDPDAERLALKDDDRDYGEAVAGASSSHSCPSSSSIASKGSARTTAASAQMATMVHAPSRRRSTSSVLSAGFRNHAWATPASA
jgi:hypothetical protein